MFENTICCVYSKGGMPPVAPRLSTSTFKLTLRRFLRPFTWRSHRPQTPPPKARAAHHRDDKWRKMGRAPDCPCARKKHAAAIWGPSPNTYKYAGQRCVNDAPADAPPDRPRSLRAVDMRVDLRGRNIGMAQNLLQHTQVGTAREHVGGKGVAQGMGMEPHQPHPDAHTARISHARPGATGDVRSYLKRPPRSRFRGHGPPSENVPQLHRASELAPRFPPAGTGVPLSPYRERVQSHRQYGYRPHRAPPTRSHANRIRRALPRWHGRASPSRPRGSLDRAEPRHPPPIDTPANAQPF